MSRKYSLIVCLFLTACFTQPYRQAMNAHEFGYSDRKISENQYYLRLKLGNNLNNEDEVYWLRRISELCNGPAEEVAITKAERTHTWEGHSAGLVKEGIVTCPSQ